MSPQRVQTLRSSVKNTRPTPGTREPGELYVSFPDLQLGTINAARAPIDLIAVRFFSAATNYATGDFVVYLGKGYKAKNAITAGAFNPADWDTITVTGDYEPPIAAGTTAQYWRGDKSWQTLDKNAVGLSQVDNVSDANKPVSSAQQTALNLKANLAGPTFTGDPKAPTPTYPDNDTSIATTAFVSTNFAPILSPTLGGDPKLATSPPTADNDTSIASTAYVQANLLTYAPLASPAFTGNPTAPTATLGDNDTTVATTAFVTSMVGTVVPFPEAPVDGLTYGRKNAAWATMVGGAVISDVAPSAPLQNGQLWFKSNSGDTFIYVDDGNSTQWVQQNVVPPTLIPSNYTTKTAETRNRLVNGAFQHSQENGNTASAASGALAYYAADQWIATSLTTGTSTFQRLQVATPNGSVNRVRMTINTADTSLSAGEYLSIIQNIEGVRVADFKWGTVSPRPLVLRFGWKSPAGTYSIAIRNSANLRSYVANFTVSAGQANTDTEQIIVIPGDTAGSWTTDTGIGLYLSFVLAAGATLTGVAGWQAGSILATASNTNGLFTPLAVFELFDVGLYMDSESTGLPPKWVMPDEAEELRACRRYLAWYKAEAIAYFYATGAGQAARTAFQFQTQMRSVPAISFPTTVYVNASGLAAQGTNLDGLRVTATSGAAGQSSTISEVIANSRM